MFSTLGKHDSRPRAIHATGLIGFARRNRRRPPVAWRSARDP